MDILGRESTIKPLFAAIGEEEAKKHFYATLHIKFRNFLDVRN